MLERLERLRKELKRIGANGAIISSVANRRYLSGFTGSAGWIVTALEGTPWLLTDSRYVEQASAQAEGFRVVRHGQALQGITAAVGELGLRTVAFEDRQETVRGLQQWQGAMTGVSFTPLGDVIEQLRLVKDETEIAAIARACALVDKAFTEIVPNIRVGVSERDLGLDLEWRLRTMGAQGAAFSFIVASGPRSSMPHGTASERVLQPGDLLTFDFGAVVDGYCSDITRTVGLSPLPEKAWQVYGAVLEAQIASLEAVRSGVNGHDVDARARNILGSHGLADAFGHSLGHGIGIEVHEGPRLAPTSDDVLRAGMVVTIEPGVYLPGFGGVRIEDTVVVRDEGPQILTHFTKELLILP